jgi:hypothetical protein
MHINKTAGTSIQEWFRENFNEYDLKSANPQSKKTGHELITEFKDNIFYFTVVRNPYNRIASHYFQWDKYGWWKPEIEDLNSFIRHLPNINTYEDIGNIVNHLDRNTMVEFFKPCTHWIGDINKFKIFKTEKLDELTIFFQKIFNKNKLFRKKLERNEHTKTKALSSYKHFYNDNSIEIIKDLFKEDFDNFGYQK